MAEVVNTIGSLSTLKKELQRNRIDQFNSIKDITEFERTYEQQLLAIKKKVRSDLLDQLESMEANLEDLRQAIERKTEVAESEIEERIGLIQVRRDALGVYQNRFVLKDWYLHLLDSTFRRKSRRLAKRKSSYVEAQTSDDRSTLKILSERHDELNNNFDDHFQRIEVAKSHHIWHTKETIEALRPFILGTIGENRVASTLSSLPDNYTVINDVNVKLDRPIYNRKENDRIFSFQIDHVVIGPGGVFVIETKHWSERTISNSDLFSPVKQIRRSGYALFSMINSAIRKGNINLDDNWGDRSVSVRNLIAFSASSVSKKYEHVKLLELSSLNGYIEWFKQELSESDTRIISAYVQNICTWS